MTSRSTRTRAVSDVLARIEPLADWLKQNKPSCAVITLTRRDFDLLLKHPTASGVTVNGNTAYWRTFELRALPQLARKDPT